MARVTKWVAFYANDKKYDSEIFEPENLPSDGVLWIKEFTVNSQGNKGMRNVHGLEYYRWTGDAWAGGGPKDLRRWMLAYYPDSRWAKVKWTSILLVELEDWIREQCPEIKLGLWVSDAEYEKVAEQVEVCCDG